MVSAYAGSDILKPYVQKLKQTGKDIFVVLRTANKSAAELQDLLTGSRLVHMAAADVVNRFADALVDRSGYSQIAVIGPASVADILKKIRKNLLIGSCGNMGELYEAVANNKSSEKISAFYDFFEIYPLKVNFLSYLVPLKAY